MSVFEANQKSLSPQIFIIFLPSSVLSQALVGIFAEYILHPRQLQYCMHYCVERSAAIIGRPARVIGSISQKVITLPYGVITTYFLQLLDCLCYLSAINSMNTFIII